MRAIFWFVAAGGLLVSVASCGKQPPEPAREMPADSVAQSAQPNGAVTSPAPTPSGNKAPEKITVNKSQNEQPKGNESDDAAPRMEGGVRIATAQQLVDDCEKRPAAVIKKYQPNAGVNKLIVEGEVKELQTWTFGGLGGVTVVFVSEGKLAVHARLKSGAQTALNPGDKARVEGIFQGTSQWTGDENKILMASAKVLWPDSPTRVNDAEEKALALIKNQSPGVERDEAAPGKPVTGVALYGQRETDATLKELCAFKCLKTLSLSSPSVTDAGLKELAALKNLYQLNVGGTSVTDAGLKELAAFKYLTSLTLNKTKVTDIGLKELAAIKNLKSLNLADTKVTDAGIKELVALKNLTYLDLAGTKVSGAGLNQLRSALPTCKIGK